MSVEEMNVNIEEEMVEDLMAEEFSDLVPNYRRRASREVTITTLRQGDPINEIPEGIPFQPPIPPPISSDFALWRCRLSQE